MARHQYKVEKKRKKKQTKKRNAHRENIRTQNQSETKIFLSLHQLVFDHNNSNLNSKYPKKVIGVCVRLAVSKSYFP